MFDDSVKENLISIVVILFLGYIFIFHTTNKERCERLTVVYNRDYAQELEEVGNLVNKDIVVADSFFISILINSKTIRTINEKSHGLVIITDTTEYEKMRKNLLSLSNKPDFVSFNKHKKIVRFGYTDEKTSVLFMAKKKKLPICEFKGTNYPPWYLDEWVYEIKPQWYILYNTSSREFIESCNSLDGVK